MAISAVSAIASLPPGVGSVQYGAADAPRARTPVRQEDETAQKVARLREIDRKVRAHEAAHVAAGGGLVTRGAQFTTVRGPDGQQYAVAGDVRIDVSPGKTPEETLQKAERIRAAALAPPDPSPQDRMVAAKAAQMAAAARIELAKAQQQEAKRAQDATEPSDPTRFQAQRALARYRVNGA
ncbi:putative metalloprotease CJM1_0395 family protein [Hydrogenophilus thiooxidans]|uniref:putative metalloprotease CJM1_0395 family protein n=1 Tax=Hydrogenophilus thiooxidans TaxID=2820326 RepID=UPI001C246342|nr:putative metalloprotease CJM1_0395 family protein [Hydrogenophilus thiooxidans]